MTMKLTCVRRGMVQICPYVERSGRAQVLDHLKELCLSDMILDLNFLDLLIK
jgi:hypothetical protein